jgi:hypothetical protein
MKNLTSWWVRVIRLRSAELEIYKGLVEPRNSTTEKDAIQSVPAYCRQPALRLRFSASEFQALASVLNKY